MTVNSQDSSLPIGHSEIAQLSRICLRSLIPAETSSLEHHIRIAVIEAFNKFGFVGNLRTDLGVEFVTFSRREAADSAISQRYVMVQDTLLEVKEAYSRTSPPTQTLNMLLPFQSGSWK